MRKFIVDIISEGVLKALQQFGNEIIKDPAGDQDDQTDLVIDQYGFAKTPGTAVIKITESTGLRTFEKWNKATPPKPVFNLSVKGQGQTAGTILQVEYPHVLGDGNNHCYKILGKPNDTALLKLNAYVQVTKVEVLKVY